MKFIKKVMAVLLIFVMAFTVVGCGKMTPADLIKKVSAQTANIKSMEAVMDMDMGFTITAGGEEQNMTTKAKSNIYSTIEPLAVKLEMNMNMNAGGQAQDMDMEIYVVEEDGNIVTYTGFAGMWQKQALSAEQQKSILQQYDAKSNLNLYLENVDSFTEVVTEKLDGVEVYRLNGTLTGDSLQKAVEAAGALQQLDQIIGSNAEEMEAALFKDMGDMPIVIWVDKKDYMPVRYEMDMTQVMQKMMANMFGVISETTGEALPEDFAFDCSSMKIIMNITGVNNVAPIEVPQEALDNAVGA